MFKKFKDWFSARVVIGFHNGTFWTMKKIWLIPEHQNESQLEKQYNSPVVTISGLFMLLLITILVYCLGCYCYYNCCPMRWPFREDKKRSILGKRVNGSSRSTSMSTPKSASWSSKKTPIVSAGGGKRSTVDTSGFDGTSVFIPKSFFVGGKSVAGAGEGNSKSVPVKGKSQA